MPISVGIGIKLIFQEVAGSDSSLAEYPQDNFVIALCLMSHCQLTLHCFIDVFCAFIVISFSHVLSATVLHEIIQKFSLDASDPTQTKLTTNR